MGLFITQLADGISGLGNCPSSLWLHINDYNVTTSKIFSRCLSGTDLASADRMLAGAMTLGGTNTALHRSGIEDEGGGEFGHDLYCVEDASGGGEFGTTLGFDACT